MVNDIREPLKVLGIDDTGRYEDGFYVIDLEDSNDYARMYSKLDKRAVNTEYPQFGVNSAGTTAKITNYFELTVGTVTYDIFLFADFENDKYYVKLTERAEG